MPERSDCYWKSSQSTKRSHAATGFGNRRLRLGGHIRHNRNNKSLYAKGRSELVQLQKNMMAFNQIYSHHEVGLSFPGFENATPVFPMSK